jgi:hypothetical protein
MRSTREGPAWFFCADLVMESLRQRIGTGHSEIGFALCFGTK